MNNSFNLGFKKIVNILNDNKAHFGISVNSIISMNEIEYLLFVTIDLIIL